MLELFLISLMVFLIGWIIGFLTCSVLAVDLLKRESLFDALFDDDKDVKEVQ